MIQHRCVSSSLLYMRFRKFIPKGLRPFVEQKLIYGLSPHAFDLYMSLGENCLPATALKQVNLRKFSGPFDWIAKSDFATRVSQIENDFDGTLEYEDLVFDFSQKTDNRHNAYSVTNKRTGFIYPHDFQDDSLECYETQRIKYSRRQKRMYELCENKNGLFIYSDLRSGKELQDYTAETIELFFSLMERIRTKLKMKKLSLILGVKVNDENSANSLEVLSKNSLRLFIQPIPSKFLAEDCDMFGWPTIYLKRALRVAMDLELRKG